MEPPFRAPQLRCLFPEGKSRRRSVRRSDGGRGSSSAVQTCPWKHPGRDTRSPSLLLPAGLTPPRSASGWAAPASRPRLGVTDVRDPLSSTDPAQRTRRRGPGAAQALQMLSHLHGASAHHCKLFLGVAQKG